MLQKTALLSVYNKGGIVEFAQELIKLNFQILASGGTAKKLKENNIVVKDIAEIVGAPILGHRVVSLSREIHAGLLARDCAEDKEELKKLNIPWIDLVCVDLYPLEEEINKVSATRESIIEQTDIGGPTMLRSAAKGGRIVICDLLDRQKVINWLKNGEFDKAKFLQNLQAKAEKIVAEYALKSAIYHSENNFTGIIGEKKIACKYGENPDQAPAAFFETKNNDRLALNKFKIVSGETPSYNTLTDIDRLLQTITHIAAGLAKNNFLADSPFIALGAKHGNCCGAGIGKTKKETLEKMLSGDLRAIFGGFVAVNFKIGKEEAEILLGYKQEGRRILDGIIASEFSAEAIKMLERKAGRCKLLANSSLENLDESSLDQATRFRYARGGFLMQANYKYILDLNDLDIEKTEQADEQIEKDFVLAWAIGATSNSNTVSLVKDGQLIGNGVGQQDRVGGCELALKRAKDANHETKNAISYSDSFFPFTDGTEALSKAGVKAILAYSGSVRDNEVKEYCIKNNITLYLIPNSKGRGFFGH